MRSTAVVRPVVLLTSLLSTLKVTPESETSTVGTSSVVRLTPVGRIWVTVSIEPPPVTVETVYVPAQMPELPPLSWISWPGFSPVNVFAAAMNVWNGWQLALDTHREAPIMLPSPLGSGLALPNWPCRTATKAGSSANAFGVVGAVGEARYIVLRRRKMSSVG